MNAQTRVFEPAFVFSANWQMADGDYERGRGREIGAIAAELKRLAEAREKRAADRMTAEAPDGSPQHGETSGHAAATAMPDTSRLNGKGAHG